MSENTSGFVIYCDPKPSISSIFSIVLLVMFGEKKLSGLNNAQIVPQEGTNGVWIQNPSGKMISLKGSLDEMVTNVIKFLELEGNPALVQFLKYYVIGCASNQPFDGAVLARGLFYSLPFDEAMKTTLALYRSYFERQHSFVSDKTIAKSMKTTMVGNRKVSYGVVENLLVGDAARSSGSAYVAMQLTDGFVMIQGNRKKGVGNVLARLHALLETVEPEIWYCDETKPWVALKKDQHTNLSLDILVAMIRDAEELIQSDAESILAMCQGVGMKLEDTKSQLPFVC